MTDAGKGPARGYRWEPFTEGHTKSVQHGAYSPRIAGPVATQIVDELLSSGDCPDHLVDDEGRVRPRWQSAVEAWSRAESQVRLLAAFMATQDAGAALTETTESEEDAKFSEGRSSKRISAKRTQATIDALDRAERRAHTLREALGLTPAAAARMRVDVASKYDSAMHVVAVLQHDQEATGGN